MKETKDGRGKGKREGKARANLQNYSKLLALAFLKIANPPATAYRHGPLTRIIAINTLYPLSSQFHLPRGTTTIILHCLHACILWGLVLVKPSAGAAACRPTSSHKNMDDASPPTKRVRINEGDKTEPDDGNGTDIPFSQEFLTPPSSATVSESSSSSPAAEAVLTHDNLGGAAAEGSPNAATGASPAKCVFYTPRRRR